MPRSVPRSESEAWGTVLRRITAMRALIFGKSTKGPSLVLTAADQEQFDTLCYAVEQIAREMMGQTAQGLHKNPALVMYGLNPPEGGEQLMSRRVYRLEYKHQSDGENYAHDFATGVNMYITRGGRTVILYRPDGKPLAKDFR